MRIGNQLSRITSGIDEHLRKSAPSPSPPTSRKTRVVVIAIVILHCLAGRRSESIHAVAKSRVHSFSRTYRGSKQQIIMMYILGILCTLLVATSATEFCYNDVAGACSTNPLPTDGPLLANCNAKFGGFEALQPDLQAYANAHVESSFEFLLMSTHFGNYESNREGFKGLYRKLSDKAWNDAKDVIKYIATRGGKMNFNQLPRFKKNNKDRVVQLSELNSLAKALDTEKQLAEEALRIHTQAQHHAKQDAAVAHYIEEKFFESQSETIRNLAGHTSVLKSLLAVKDNSASVSVFLFDEYLRKIL